VLIPFSCTCLGLCAWSSCSLTSIIFEWCHVGNKILYNSHFISYVFLFHFCSVLWNFVWITLNFNFKVLRIFYIQVMYQELKNNHRIFFKSFNLSDGILTVYLWCNRSKLRMFSTASSNVSSMLFCNWIDFLVFPILFFQRFR